MLSDSAPRTSPGEVDTDEAARAARRIRDYLGTHPDEDLHEVRMEGDDSDVLVVPRAAAVMLAQAMAILAEGQGVTLVPSDAHLTTQQAADMLNVSRPYLIGLLESGLIEYSKVGRHRRIPFGALMEYKRQAERRGRAIADEMSDLGQEIGL